MIGPEGGETVSPWAEARGTTALNHLKPQWGDTRDALVSPRWGFDTQVAHSGGSHPRLRCIAPSELMAR